MNTDMPDHPPPLEAPALHRPKRKYVRKAKVPMYPREVREAMKPVVKPNPPLEAPAGEHEFAGLTTMTCCDRCFELRCVITGIAYCGRGGLQPISMSNRVVIDRYARAKEYMRTGR